MVDLLLYDGTKDLKSGKILGYALEEIARFYRGGIDVTPEPGTWDIPRWTIVDNIVKNNFRPKRNQVHYKEIRHDLRNVPEIANNPDSKKIVLIESDLYDGSSRGDLSWCFGGCDSNNEYIIVSTARITDPIHELGVYLHELGHMFGAAPCSRSHTEENLGSHCTNDYCVMQQKLTVPEFSEHDNEIADMIENGSRDSWFCEQCQDDIIENVTGV